MEPNHWARAVVAWCLTVLGKATENLEMLGTQLAGVPLSQWLLLASLIYTVLNTYVLLRDRVFNRKE